jgi:hypothetical protein
VSLSWSLPNNLNLNGTPKMANVNENKLRKLLIMFVIERFLSLFALTSKIQGGGRKWQRAGIHVTY